MTTCENYEAYSHQQIRHEMYDGAGPSSQSDVAAGWRELAGRLTAIRQYLDSAVSGVQTTQHGAAADAAVEAMVPLGAWVDEAQRLADDTQERISHQISGFTTTRDSIPEIPPEPRGWGWQDIPIIDSFTTSDQEADEARNAELERQARAAMMAYQKSSNERVASVAQFVPPPTGEPDLTIPAGHRSGIGALPGSAGGGSGAGATSVPGSVTPLAGGMGSAPGELPAATPAAVPAPTGPQGGSTGGAEYGGGRPAPAALVPPGGGIPGDIAPGAFAIGGSRGAGAGPLGAGRNSPGSAPGGRPGLGSAGGLRSGAAGGFGSAGSSDSAARGAGAAGAGRVGGAGTAGGVAPFGGVGGNRGGEDNERQRPSYLVEPDSNRLIGDLPRTAPPVIGDDPPGYPARGRR